MVDQIKNNLNSLGSAGSNKVSSDSKKSSSIQVKGIDHSSAKQKYDSSEVSKFVTKEKIKDMAKEPPIDQAATSRIKNAIANGSYPIDLDKMALSPCHVMCQFYVDTINNRLDCQLYQRSGDMFLGVPFNIASYSFLTYIIAKITGYQPGKLIHILGDTHIYDSHIEAVCTQIKRIPYSFPKLTISDDLNDIDNINEEYFKLENYIYHDKISAPMIA